MHQISSIVNNRPANNRPALGALYMVGAGIAFALANTITPIITYRMGVPSTAVVFWQYLLATLFALPLIVKIGFAALKTSHPILHEWRGFVSALGVQIFAFGFASGVPLWQMVALSMTAPFFIITGSVLFLGERLTPQRLGAALLGFCGAVLVSGIGTESFSAAALLPICSAALWGSASVLTRYLARSEKPESLTLYLLVLITPNHLLIGLMLGVAVALFPAFIPASLANGFDLALPVGDALGLIVLLGLLAAASQYCLSLAYSAADATFLQPFDDLKLPFNTLIGWLVLSQVPSIWFWPGAALIVGASLFILSAEARTAGPPATRPTPT